MKPRTIVIAGAALLAAMVAIVLARYGVEESGWRVVIRATARTSALCIALAFAGIAMRPMLVLLPVSHGLHFAAILAVAFLTTPANAHISITSLGGIVIFALMIDTALRPKPGGIAMLWVIFLIAYGVRDMSQPVYPLTLGVLLAGGAVLLIKRLMRVSSILDTSNPRT